MSYEQRTITTQFIIHLTTMELEAMLRKVVTDVVRESRPAALAPLSEEPLLSIEALCRKLQVSRDLVYRLRKQGKLPQYQVGKRKFFKFSEVLISIRTNR